MGCDDPVWSPVGSPRSGDWGSSGRGPEGPLPQVGSGTAVGSRGVLSGRWTGTSLNVLRVTRDLVWAGLVFPSVSG